MRAVVAAECIDNEDWQERISADGVRSFVRMPRSENEPPAYAVTALTPSPPVVLGLDIPAELRRPLAYPVLPFMGKHRSNAG